MSGFNCHLLLKNASGSSFSFFIFTQVSDFWTHSYYKKIKALSFSSQQVNYLVTFFANTIVRI